MTSISAAQRDLANLVMGRPGVTGVAQGELAGKPCLKVYVAGGESPKLPKKIGGYRVVLERSGAFKRL